VKTGVHVIEARDVPQRATTAARCACHADVTRTMKYGDMILKLPSGLACPRIRSVIERIAAVCRRRTMV